MKDSLPIFSYREDIVSAVKNNRVVVITAETGAGKSTQVCQFLYEAGYEVVVTEPRRLAAKTLAERVALETNTLLGGTVGFRTAFERNDSAGTGILFCTDGLQLVRTLSETQDKDKVLIIDEVHEWNLNIETLIAWAKKRCNEGWKTRVVIMSATLDKQRLGEYFGGNVPIIDVPGRLYPVEFAQRDENEFIQTIKEMARFGKNVLAFVAGKKEIFDTIDLLNGLDAMILPLHGELESEEQGKCFKTYNVPKVIVSTNVAQTSITIPDIDVVVDTGLEKRIEMWSGIEGLFSNHISQADCKQRQGRAGRTKDGKYFLCSDTKFEYRPEFSTPEIQRSILDQVVLRLAAAGIDATQLEFFHSPRSEDLIAAKNTLNILGAVKGDAVTEIGYRMARMPISVRYARMVIEAERLGVVDDVIAIVSILEAGSSLIDNKRANYMTYTTEHTSDLLAELDVWKKISVMGFIDFKVTGINGKTYFKVKELLRKLYKCLEDSIVFGSSGDKMLIKKACVAGMVDQLYSYRFGTYSNSEFWTIQLDKKSCLNEGEHELIVGKPMTIQYENKYGQICEMNLLSMATKVEIEWLLEMAPQLVKVEEDSPKYDSLLQMCTITKKTYFNGVRIKSEDVPAPNHPDAARLKAEWDERVSKPEWGFLFRYEEERRRAEEENAHRQKSIVAGGTIFSVEYDWNNSPRIYVTPLELFAIKEKSLRLDNGTPLQIICGKFSANNVPALIEMVEKNRVEDCWNRVKNSLPSISSAKRSVVTEWFSKLGRVEITRSEGGKGEPVYGFVHLLLKDNVIAIRLSNNENDASKSNDEALRFLFGREVITKYPSKKAFQIKRDGKSFMTAKGQEAKELFDSFVQESLNGLTAENFQERLDGLDEIFAEVTNAM